MIFDEKENNVVILKKWKFDSNIKFVNSTKK